MIRPSSCSGASRARAWMPGCRPGSGADSNEMQRLRRLAAAWSKAPRASCKSVEEISRLQQGDILVCQVTNPTWAPIFQKIAAAVSDIGGSMSHAAIVAREYGLPAVVGTGNATSRIKDGQRIRVDGGRGIVTIAAVGVAMPSTAKSSAGSPTSGLHDRPHGGRQGRQPRRAAARRHRRAAGLRGATAAFERFIGALEARGAGARARRGAGCRTISTPSRAARSELRARIEAAPLPADVAATRFAPRMRSSAAASPRRRSRCARRRPPKMPRMRASPACRTPTCGSRGSTTLLAQDPQLLGQPLFGRVDELSPRHGIAGSGRGHGGGGADAWSMRAPPA